MLECPLLRAHAEMLNRSLSRFPSILHWCTQKQIDQLPQTTLLKRSQLAIVGDLLLTPISLSSPGDLFLPRIFLGTASG